MPKTLRTGSAAGATGAVAVLSLALIFGAAGPAMADLTNVDDELLVFVSVAPCRIVRTGSSTGGNLAANVAQDFLAYGDATAIGPQGGVGSCPHPKAAEGRAPVAMATNVTAVGNQALANGNIVAFPAGGAAATASLVNFTPNANIANATIVGLCATGCPGGKHFSLRATQNVPAIVDVVGYFYRRSPLNVVTVAPAGADFTSPLDALAAITDASETNPYLVRIGPGEYDLGLLALSMQSHVDVEGAGRCATVIKSAAGNDVDTGIVVRGASDAVLRDLCIEGTANPVPSENIAIVGISNSGVSTRYERILIEVGVGGEFTNGIGIRNTNGSSVQLVGVTVGTAAINNSTGIDQSTGSTATVVDSVIEARTSSGIAVGIKVDGAQIDLHDSSVTAEQVTAGGPWVAVGLDIENSGDAVVTTSTLSGVGAASTGVRFTSSVGRISWSTLVGDTDGYSIDSASTGARIFNSLIINGGTDGAAGVNCFQNYDTSLGAVSC